MSWKIESDRQAEWAIHKIREHQAEAEKWKLFYKEQMDKAVAECQAKIDILTADLQLYFEMVPHRSTKTRETYALPGGKLVRSKQHPEYKVDNEALLQWLDANDSYEYIRIERKPDWASLKKTLVRVEGSEALCTEDGEIVAGVTAVDRPDKFEVKLEKEEEGNA